MKRNIKTIEELDEYQNEHIQGVFTIDDMKVIQGEVEKLKPGQVYLEIGVAQGKSLTTAYFCSEEGVFTIGIDSVDSEKRLVFFRCPLGFSPTGQNLVDKDSGLIYINADSHMVAKIWNTPIDILFIDGAHDPENVEKDIRDWWGKVKIGGTILFHDYNCNHAEGVKIAVDKFFDDKVIIFDNYMAKVIKTEKIL